MTTFIIILLLWTWNSYRRALELTTTKKNQQEENPTIKRNKTNWSLSWQFWAAVYLLFHLLLTLTYTVEKCRLIHQPQMKYYLSLSYSQGFGCFEHLQNNQTYFMPLKGKVLLTLIFSGLISMSEVQFMGPSISYCTMYSSVLFLYL